MSAAPDTAVEPQRLQALRALDVLDSAPEAEFDALAEAASLVCGVPVSLISLVDSERQWFKANVGLPGVSETARDVAFCSHAIESDDLFEVPDATQDPRFAANPLVMGQPDIRFYAGAPLRLSDGHRVGTLCVIDRRARTLDDNQRQVLRHLALAAARMLERRHEAQLQKLAETALASSEARYRAMVEDQSELISMAGPDGRLTFVNAAYAQHYGQTVDELLGRNLLDFVSGADRDGVAAHLKSVCDASPLPLVGVNRSVSASGRQRWISWTNRAIWSESEQSLQIHSVGRDFTEQHLAEDGLREALRERETLLREVYHRVKNNLQVVQSLLNLQRRGLPEGAARAVFDDCVRQVRAMALVHEKLYQNGSLAAVSLRDYTIDLLHQLGEGLGTRARGISLRSDVAEFEASLDLAIPYGLLVTELVGNSVKHGFPGDRTGEVRLSLSRADTGLMLRVADNGVSLPADFDLQQTESMGLQLAASLAAQLGGSLSAHDESGAVFTALLLRLE